MLILIAWRKIEAAEIIKSIALTLKGWTAQPKVEPSLMELLDECRHWFFFRETTAGKQCRHWFIKDRPRPPWHLLEKNDDNNTHATETTMVAAHTLVKNSNLRGPWSWYINQSISNILLIALSNTKKLIFWWLEVLQQITNPIPSTFFLIITKTHLPPT
jgi:hypothetical protein